MALESFGGLAEALEFDDASTGGISVSGSFVGIIPLADAGGIDVSGSFLGIIPLAEAAFTAHLMMSLEMIGSTTASALADAS